MGRIHTALKFSEWALEFMIVPPICFAFLLAAISLVWAAQKQRPFQTRMWKPHYWLALTHLLFFAAAILVGVLGQNPVTNPTITHPADKTAQLLLDVVTYGSLASCGFFDLADERVPVVRDQPDGFGRTDHVGRIVRRGYVNNGRLDLAQLAVERDPLRSMGTLRTFRPQE